MSISSFFIFLAPYRITNNTYNLYKFRKMYHILKKEIVIDFLLI